MCQLQHLFCAETIPMPETGSNMWVQNGKPTAYIVGGVGGVVSPIKSRPMILSRNILCGSTPLIQPLPHLNKYYILIKILFFYRSE